MLQSINIENFTTENQKVVSKLSLSYETFGLPLHSAPVVLVNHALTGNSTVCGKHGWWNGLIGPDKCIDTNRYTILSFNIPGNGYYESKDVFNDDYKLFTASDIAALFTLGLSQLGVDQLHALIGGSVGGGIAWELAVQNPNLIHHLIPVATDWKSTDWLKANCLVQELILKNSSNPVHDARLHAMMLYRSPKSFKQKFNRSFNEDKSMFNVESWLLHHGDKLTKRFRLDAYLGLNHILANIDISKSYGSFENALEKVSSQIVIISVDSDTFFTLEEDVMTVEKLRAIDKKVNHGIIRSDHGHDAFLIEFEQLTEIIKDIF
ncbi:alpha/beta fold hydrolase [Aquimarina brevivitae]|uniref:Homoserine O-acetyltransferase n=1 Tax=Aquimarina brevivitae TaxID=323412 RepID=A0A4Q7NY63_9FLAO|nr:alpha/beta fold hydrolase [Aquimarina brevivitae]RZS92245.1 homoserine O-acetyltransferase [Aquimarina brevivitae]